MNAQGDQGYAYRRARATRADALQLALALPGGPLWGFGGAALWDFSRGAGRANLRPVAPIAALSGADFRGDFGHLFTAEAELRWRRLDVDAYDLLLLRETPLDPATEAQLGLSLIGLFDALEIPRAYGVRLDEGPGRLGLVEYRDPRSRAVRLVRYTP